MEKYWKYTIASFIGVLLFAFDFELFLAAIPGLETLFHFTLNDINIIDDTAFGVSAVAAFTFGPLADKYGRKLLFMLTILIYSIGSLFSALSVSVLDFVGARSVVSVGTGPDEPLGFTLTAETAPPLKRGRQMLITSIGFPVGQALGAATVYLFVLNSVYLPYVFFIGIIPALSLLFLRKGLPETDRFKDLKKVRDEIEGNKEKDIKTEYKVNTKELKKGSYRQLFDVDLRRKSVLIAIYTTIIAGNVAISLIALPIYYVDVKHITFVTTLSFEFISFGIAAIGYIVVAMIGNKIGRKNVIIIFLILTFATIFGIIFSTNGVEVLTFNVLFIFFLFSQYAAWPFYVNEMFPTRVRASASTYGYAFQWLGNIILPTSILSIVTITSGDWVLGIVSIMIIPIVASIIVSFLLPKDNPTAVLENNAY
jgi:MFS family permease